MNFNSNNNFNGRERSLNRPRYKGSLLFQQGYNEQKLYFEKQEAADRVAVQKAAAQQAELLRNKELKSTMAMQQQITRARNAVQMSQIRTGEYFNNPALRVDLNARVPYGGRLNEGQILERDISLRQSALTNFQQKEREVRSKLEESINKGDIAGMKQYQGQLTAIASGAKEVANQHRNMSERLREWGQQHTLIGWITRFWEKLQTVFVRVASALLSFVAIRAVTQLVGNFFRSIVDSNAQLEVMDARLSLMTKDKGVFDQLRRRIVELTITTPYIIKDFIGASVALQAFGIKANNYLKPVADWATAIGRDLNDMSVAFAKIVSGSPRTALLLTTRGITKAEFDRELVATGDRLTALANIIEKKYGGMAQRVSETFTGMISNIKDAWFVLSSVVGKDLFVKLRQDVSLLFDTIKGQIYNTSPIITAFSKIIGILYDSLKVIFGALIVGSIIKFASALKGINLIALTLSSTWTSFIAKHQVLNLMWSGATSAISLWSVGISAAILLGVEYYQTLSHVNDASKEAADLLRKFGPDSEAYINALKQQKQAIIELNNSWLLYVGNKLLLGFAERETDVNNKRIEAIDKAIERSQQLVNLTVAQNELYAQQISALQTINLKSKIEGLVGGVETRTLMMAEIRRMLSAGVISEDTEVAPKGREGALKFLDQLKDKAKALGITLKAAKDSIFAPLGEFGPQLGPSQRFTKEGSPPSLISLPLEQDHVIKLISLYSILTDTQKDRKELEESFMKEILPRTREFLNNLKGVTDVGQAANSFFDNFSKKAKDGLKSLADYGEKNKTLWEQIAALMGGAGKVEARVAAFEAINKETGVPLKVEKFLNIFSDPNPLIQARKMNAFLREWKQNLEDLNTLDLRRIDLQNKQEAQEKVAEERRKATFNFELDYRQRLLGYQDKFPGQGIDWREEYSAQLDGLRQLLPVLEKKIKMAQAEEKTAQFRLRRVDSNLPEYSRLYDNLTKKQTTTNGLIDEERQKRLEIISILEKMRDLPSENISEAWSKLMKQLEDSADKIWDDLASTFLSSTTELVKSYINDLIYGNQQLRDINKQITDTQFELSIMYRDQINAQNKLNTLRRKDYESNDQYLQRVQFMSEIQAQQVDVYTFQTKEMETLKKINELELQRNQLIYDRLRALGQKITDKILDYGLNMLVGGLFGGGNTGGGYSPDNLGTPVPETNYAPIRMGGGGSTVNLHFNAPVYGMGDFERQVETSMRKVTQRRSG